MVDFDLNLIQKVELGLVLNQKVDFGEDCYYCIAQKVRFVWNLKVGLVD